MTNEILKTHDESSRANARVTPLVSINVEVISESKKYRSYLFHLAMDINSNPSNEQSPILNLFCIRSKKKFLQQGDLNIFFTKSWAWLWHGDFTQQFLIWDDIYLMWDARKLGIYLWRAEGSLKSIRKKRSGETLRHTSSIRWSYGWRRYAAEPATSACAGAATEKQGRRAALEAFLVRPFTKLRLC